jgi:hypothetical protein
MRNKLTLLIDLQVARGRILNGYVLGGPARGTVAAVLLDKIQARGDAATNAQPD